MPKVLISCVLASVAVFLSGCGCLTSYDCCAENGGSGQCDASSRPCCKACGADMLVDASGECTNCERGKFAKSGSLKADGETVCTACGVQEESVCSGFSGCQWDSPYCQEITCPAATDYSTCVNKLTSACAWDNQVSKCFAQR
mmetsp:Transcript_23079/g.69380  ORF Transcript_23079/g.69380 Transcript_23079/m.69380 type:complete len:143 (-) Transcript_23079:227-655(-)